MAFHLVAEAADELMGEVEDEDAGVMDGLFKGGCGDQVGRERDIGQVLDVLML